MEIFSRMLLMFKWDQFRFLFPVSRDLLPVCSSDYELLPVPEMVQSMIVMAMSEFFSVIAIVNRALETSRYRIQHGRELSTIAIL